MGLVAWKIYFTLRDLIEREEAQDMVEYAMVIGLMALAAVSGMNTLASEINTGLTKMGSFLTGAVP